MPRRITPLINGQIYHIFNRGIEKRRIFLDANQYKHAQETIWFYQKDNLPIRLSELSSVPTAQKPLIWERIKKLPKRVEIVAYCLMPNHIHLLLKQTIDNGISTFMSDVQNSYARYFNIKNKRKGHLFEGQFKAVRIENDDQLIHVSRYIHLNPATSFLVGESELEKYLWSSFLEYVNEEMPQKCAKDIILAHFKTRSVYKEFVYDQVNYQRNLKLIERALFEDD